MNPSHTHTHAVGECDWEVRQMRGMKGSCKQMKRRERDTEQR